VQTTTIVTYQYTFNPIYIVYFCFLATQKRQLFSDANKIETLENTLGKAQDKIEALRHVGQVKASLEGQFKQLQEMISLNSDQISAGNIFGGVTEPISSVCTFCIDLPASRTFAKVSIIIKVVWVATGLFKIVTSIYSLFSVNALGMAVSALML
jgi:hypothetical protein